MKYITILLLALSLTVCSTTKTPKEEPFTIDWDSPKVQAGEIEIQLNNLVNITGLRKVKVDVLYYPVEDAVCLQYRVDFFTYYLFLDRDGRAAYLKALEQYKEDYAQRKLETKGSKKTRRQYGNIEVYLVWQAFAYTVRCRANTLVDLGYDLKTVRNDDGGTQIFNVTKRGAAFFTLYRREVYYADPNTPQDRKIASNEPMYFTRAQADELAELFNQELLDGLRPESPVKKRDSTIDEY